MINKLRLYEFAVCWLTLAMLFFIAVYFTNVLEVVTLGGLVAGSFLFALWTAVFVRFSKLLPRFTGIAVVIVAVQLGMQLLCTVLPGYTFTQSTAGLIFLGSYAVLGILLEQATKEII